MTLRPRLRAPALLFFCLCLGAPAQAQTAKRPLTHADYASWRSIQGAQLSADGTHLAYALVPQEGDGAFVVRNLRTGKEWRHPRGFRGPPLLAAARTTPGAGAGRGSAPTFTPDGKAVVFPIYPSKADADKARKAKSPAPRDALGILHLATGKVARVENVRNFQVPETGGAFLVYHTGARTPGKLPKKGGPDPKSGPPPKAVPSDLVLRPLAGGAERTFADVTEFALSKDGRHLVYAVASKKGDANGTYVVTPGREAPPLVLHRGPGRGSRLTWDEKQTQLAFVHDRGETASPGPRVRLFRWSRTRTPMPPLSLPLPAQAFPFPAPFNVVATAVLHLEGAPLADELVLNGKGVRPGWEIGEQGSPSFSPDGGRLFFGVVPPKAKAKVDDTPDEDKVAVELWHWKDDFIQPMQKARAEGERRRTYRAVFELRDRSCRQLADETMAEVGPAPAGDWALGWDDRPHRLLVGHDRAYSDYYLIHLREETRKPLLKKQSGPLLWSPGGRWVLAYDGKDWLSVSVPGGKVVNLTGKLSTSFAREDHDAPGPPPAYGMAGWTSDDKHALIYDRYDLWRIAADGTGAVNLTRGHGRKTKTILRRVRLDQNEKAIPADAPLLLRGDNEWSRDTGFYRVSAGGEPALLLGGARNHGMPVKAKNADVLMLTVSTFYDFPDLFIANSSFRELKKVTGANPHKAGLLWGKSELVRFKSADGVALSGVLIKPENFDPKKKYPLMVYVYERLSDRLHFFVDPRPGTSINPTYYASNGYLVFMPDVAYAVGYPGQSALKCVLPGVQAVVDKGFVNESAIGIQGHSWGGYQIAYLVTQTTRFKAASAGAPVSNMTSAYGGIRWGTGLPRQFQYEKTQSRIGGSLWERPMRFLENSPLFHADRVQTPLLMLHNDKDEAVPWYQGIEYYLALRRLGKEAYLFNYPGEAHGLRRRANQKDYTVRLQQFFDHHLKGAPKPAWMEKGIPYKAAPASGQPPREGA